MGSHYTEQDTERARLAEQSLAGISTQQLAYPLAASAAPVLRRNNLAALALIAVGVLMLLARLTPLQFEFDLRACVGCTVEKRTGVERSVSARSKLSRIGVSKDLFT